MIGHYTNDKHHTHGDLSTCSATEQLKYLTPSQVEMGLLFA